MKTPPLIRDAELHCEAKGSRFTEPRKAVLTIIAQSKTPIGAYDILRKMPNGAQPPTVYRALEFWEKEGFLHRIGSLNVYTICKAGHRHSGGQFLICNNCGTITETHICAMPKDFAAEAKGRNFHLEGWFLELRGLCENCYAGKDHQSPEVCAHQH